MVSNLNYFEGPGVVSAQHAVVDLDLTNILAERVDWQFKAFPPTDHEVTIGTVGQQGWNALSGDLLFPVMLLKEHALSHNIALMAKYCREHHVLIAPHGKTPVSPQIIQRQLHAGAWGITAATLQQVRVFRAVGVPRIILANELLEPRAIQWIADELDRDASFDFICLVDSVGAVSAMEQALDGRRVGRPIQVLVELSVLGGRAGVRTIDAAISVADAVHACPHLELAGVEGYEGVIDEAALDAQLEGVDRFLLWMKDTLAELWRRGLFGKREELIISAGGSLFFDRVVTQFVPPWNVPVPVRVVLRSGSYVTHDSYEFEQLSPLAGRATDSEHLEPALEVWGLVLSRPEPGLAIVGFGKRDVPYDVHLPIPHSMYRAGETRCFQGEVMKLNDHHAFLRIDPAADLAIGDLVGCGISHPCTTFDKWRLVPLVNPEYAVVGAIRTFL